MLKRCSVRLRTRPSKWIAAELLGRDDQDRPIVKLMGCAARDKHLERYPLKVMDRKGCEDGFDEIAWSYAERRQTGHQFRRTGESGWADLKRMPKGPNGRNLCRRCSTEVPVGRRTFCSDKCVEEWLVRSDPRRARKYVLERDNGVCAKCRRDTLDDQNVLDQIRRGRNGDWRERLVAEAVRRGYSQRDGTSYLWGSRRSLWDADHIVPVVEGGGNSDVDNLRTLCLPCHKEETRLLRARMVEAESEARRIKLAWIKEATAPQHPKKDAKRMLLALNRARKSE